VAVVLALLVQTQVALQAVMAVPVLQPKLLGRKRTTQAEAGAAVVIQLKLWAVLAGVDLALQTQALVEPRQQIPEVAGAVAGQQAQLMAVRGVAAWLSFVAAEQRLPTQAPQQLQWLVVTTYIHSLATEQ
jgi:hypothetical protein